MIENLRLSKPDKMTMLKSFGLINRSLSGLISPNVSPTSAVDIFRGLVV